jgi:beta-glucanase (GH16 family)
MRTIQSFFFFVALTLAACVPDDKSGPNPTDSTVTIPTQGESSPTSYPNMSLAWADEFTGSELSDNFWSHETGNGSNGWGNNELQFYRPQNTSIKDGHLIITAKKEAFGGKEYTSSRIITKGKKEIRYGRVDIRAALPKGQGIWPALWMLGSNFDTVSWPACGEIDIMEMVGGSGRENTVHGTVHWQNAGKHAQFGGKTTLPSGTFSEKFAVYSIIWDATSIRWLVDNKQYHVIDTTPAELDEFRRNFFFIFNVAVGGNWPGSPNSSTTFPQHLIVDYVRVFQTN